MLNYDGLFYAINQNLLF